MGKSIVKKKNGVFTKLPNRMMMMNSVDPDELACHKPISSSSIGFDHSVVLKLIFL